MFWGMPIPNGIKKKNLNQAQNDLEFMNILNELMTSNLSLFMWEGLPDTCDALSLERSLMLYPSTIMADVGGMLVILQGANGAGLNINGYPVKVWGTGRNGFNKEFRAFVPGADGSVTREATDGQMASLYPNAVICWDNDCQYPPILHIWRAASRMADLMRACDVAVTNMKTPYIVTCEESQVKSITDAVKQRNDNVATIIASKGLRIDDLKIWPTHSDSGVLKAFWEQYLNIKGQVEEVLGIPSNPNQDKRERLLVDEVNANNAAVNVNLQKRLKQRELFCERVNKVFGLNVSVRVSEEVSFNDDIREVDEDDAGSVPGDTD